MQKVFKFENVEIYLDANGDYVAYRDNEKEFFYLSDDYFDCIERVVGNENVEYAYCVGLEDRHSRIWVLCDDYAMRQVPDSGEFTLSTELINPTESPDFDTILSLSSQQGLGIYTALRFKNKLIVEVPTIPV